ncbi:hypothetical protein Glove_75g27 [Diversispora epigaea]|uniref:Uncharacterized protein n=1 Tax=Diversispora epigaea TaxID=1348612 RepID=A0A397J9R2_9GLOM|nr:hypothetical protein Glove_75g27 [Diversispora epigaea]
MNYSELYQTQLQHSQLHKYFDNNNLDFSISDQHSDLSCILCFPQTINLQFVLQPSGIGLLKSTTYTPIIVRGPTTSFLKSFKYSVPTPRFSSLAKEIDQAFTKTQNFNIDPLEVLYVGSETRDLYSDKSLRNSPVRQEDIKDVIDTNLTLQDRTATTSDAEIRKENEEIDENTETVNPNDLSIVTIFENLTIATESRRINKGKKREDFKEKTRRLSSLEYLGNSSSGSSTQNTPKEFRCENRSNRDREKDQVSSSSTITRFVDNFLERDNDQRDNRSLATFFPYQKETDENDRENSTSSRYQDFRDSKDSESSEETQERQEERLNRAIINQDQSDKLINALTGGGGCEFNYVPIPEYKGGEQDPIC